MEKEIFMYCEIYKLQVHCAEKTNTYFYSNNVYYIHLYLAGKIKKLWTTWSDVNTEYST